MNITAVNKNPHTRQDNACFSKRKLDWIRIYPSSTTAIINIFLTKVNLTDALFIHVFGKRGEKQRTLDRLGRFQERNSLFYVTSNLNEQLSISSLDQEFVNN